MIRTGPLPKLNDSAIQQVSSCSKTVLMNEDSYWTSKENSLELVKLSSINRVSFVLVSFCSKYW